MKNNYWEEKKMDSPIHLTHFQLTENLKFPQWATEICCPFCNIKINSSYIRNIYLCCNTRNFGEIAIQIACKNCSIMETLYFRENIRSIGEFTEYLLGIRSPKELPITEENMHKMQYNNVVLEMIKEKK